MQWGEWSDERQYEYDNKMINPGYKSIWRNKELEIDAGPLLRCPKCKGILMEADAKKLKTRCKHCGKWIYIEKNN